MGISVNTVGIFLIVLEALLCNGQEEKFSCTPTKETFLDDWEGANPHWPETEADLPSELQGKGIFKPNIFYFDLSEHPGALFVNNLGFLTGGTAPARIYLKYYAHVDPSPSAQLLIGIVEEPPCDGCDPFDYLESDKDFNWKEKIVELDLEQFVEIDVLGLNEGFLVFEKIILTAGKDLTEEEMIALCPAEDGSSSTTSTELTSESTTDSTSTEVLSSTDSSTSTDISSSSTDASSPSTDTSSSSTDASTSTDASSSSTDASTSSTDVSSSSTDTSLSSTYASSSSTDVSSSSTDTSSSSTEASSLSTDASSSSTDASSSSTDVSSSSTDASSSSTDASSSSTDSSSSSTDVSSSLQDDSSPSTDAFSSSTDFLSSSSTDSISSSTEDSSQSTGILSSPSTAFQSSATEISTSASDSSPSSTEITSTSNPAQDSGPDNWYYLLLYTLLPLLALLIIGLVLYYCYRSNRRRRTDPETHRLSRASNLSIKSFQINIESYPHSNNNNIPSIKSPPLSSLHNPLALHSTPTSLSSQYPAGSPPPSSVYYSTLNIPESSYISHRGSAMSNRSNISTYTGIKDPDMILPRLVKND